MYNVTKAFNDACKAPGRDLTSKIIFNGVTEIASSEVQAIVVTEQFGSSDGVTIGAAFSSQCKVTVYKQTPALQLTGGNFTPYAGIMVDGAAQFVPKGKFYISDDGVEKTGDLWLTITGYDRMAGLTEDYMPTITFPATPMQVLADVCKQASVTPPAVNMPSIQIAAPYTGTLRQQLGWLAGLIGCNAKFDATGNLVFFWYADSGLTIGPDVQYLNGLSLTADDAFTIHSLLTGTDSNPISVGTGKGITAINPYMTAEVAETVFASLNGKTMQPCTVKWRGNPAVEAGDIVTVTGTDGKALESYVMELETQIKGGMSSDLTCYGPSDTDYATPSPTEQKFQRMYQDVIKSFQDATEKIIGAQGGYFEITYDADGYPTGWMLRNTPTVEDNTKMWIMSIGGLGFSKDGGKTISNVALTMDGTINGGALAIGSVQQDAVSGLSQKFTALDGQMESKISKEEVVKDYATKKELEDIEITPGPPGPAGASVFITYHDGTAVPAAPTGDGTKNGWHIDLTSAVVWMSQKVSASASSGTWGTPVRIVGADGKPGAKGDDGVSVSATEVEYYLSTSDTELSGGTWQSTAPTITDGHYLWGRTKITYSDGQTDYTGAYCISKAMAESAKPQINQVVQSTHQQITDLQQNVNSIILSALENYVQTGDFGSYKEEVSTKLSVLTDQLGIDITKVTERIDKVDGDLQSKYSEITKAFRFTDEGLFIGETGNEILLRLDNDVLQFVRNNTPELQITAEGVEAARIKVSTLIIGNVIHAADENGDEIVY